MRDIIRIILGLEILGSLIVLGVSVWPGVLKFFVFIAILLSIIWIPLGIIGFIFAAVALVKRLRQGRPSGAAVAEAMAIPGVAFITLALLIFHIPCRIAFLGCRSAFDAAAATAPRSEQGVRFGKRIGIYTVDKYAADPRGGTFFRVYSHPDGPDTMSYGFVKGPNSNRTPFGEAHLVLYHLVDDWYGFQVSND